MSDCLFVATPCPIGWQARDKFCYLINEEEKSYEEADTTCANIGSTLTTINSADEQLFHTDVLKNKVSMPLWIGLDDKVEEGTMVWKDGAQVTYTNWANGQPDDFESNEDCVHMSKPIDDGQWNDNACDAPGIGYMCKMPMIDSLEGTGKVIEVPFEITSDPQYCPEGWTRYGAFCYIINDEQVAQYEADTLCQLDDARLTSIHSQGEQKFHEYMSKGKLIWIGLNDEETENVFVYTNGYEMDYTNWDENEPSNSGGNEDCVILHTLPEKLGKWNDISCDRKASFMCKKPVTPCPIGWQGNGESCYKVNERPVPYDEAAATCQRMNSILTSVKNVDEQTFLTGLITKVETKLWIGLDDRETEGIMQFLDGSPVNTPQ
ncbi:macrophage mannose receptor 1-like [Amphiura filiformis]|uniref:macrophage mannose receptor 1-like n=1 Tax=Amphiura filiformis TaxID=82378 RepID=UPI003B214400